MLVPSVLSLTLASVFLATETITRGVDQGLRDSESVGVEKAVIMSPDISVEDWNDVMSNCPPRRVGRLRAEIWQKLFAHATPSTHLAELNHVNACQTRPGMALINSFFCCFMCLAIGYRPANGVSGQYAYCVLLAVRYIRANDTWGAGVMVCASLCSVRGGQ